MAYSYAIKNQQHHPGLGGPVCAKDYKLALSGKIKLSTKKFSIKFVENILILLSTDPEVREGYFLNLLTAL